MWINIDRERMVVTHKHSDFRCIDDLGYIELGHSPVWTIQDNNPEAFKQFTDFELKMLYENLCGQKYTGYSVDPLVKSLSELCVSLKPLDVNVSEVTTQAEQLPLKRDKDEFYKYVAGQNEADYLSKEYRPPAMVTVEGYIPKESFKNFVPNNLAVLRVDREPVKSGNNPNITLDTIEVNNVVRVRSDSSAVPKSGSKTGRVWEIADNLRAANPSLDKKALRKLIVKTCEAEGTNSSTASVQHSKWAHARGI